MNIDVVIQSVANGYLITDRINDDVYVATDLDGFYSQRTVAGVLKTIEDAAKPQPASFEAELKV
jgi:hypothetical protein